MQAARLGAGAYRFNMQLWMIERGSPSDCVIASREGDEIISVAGRTSLATWSGLSVMDPAWKGILSGEHARGKVFIADTSVPDQTNADPQDALDARPWEIWGTAFRAQLQSACEAVREIARNNGCTMLLTPTATGVLSDIPSVLHFARDHADRSIAILLEPAAMLTESMLASAEDHLARLFALGAVLDGVRGVVVSNAKQNQSGTLVPTDVEDGLVPQDVLARVVGEAGPAIGSKPCIIRGDVARVRGWLGG